MPPLPCWRHVRNALTTSTATSVDGVKNVGKEQIVLLLRYGYIIRGAYQSVD